MKILIKEFSGNITNFLRFAGYHPDKHQRNKSLSFSRPLLNDRYPRFHIYYDIEKKEINLHLDHKAPQYKNAPDHGAEYDGKIVKEEARRVKSFL